MPGSSGCISESYLAGTHVPQSNRKAVRRQQQAARLNALFAETALGRCYKPGMPVPRNHSQAIFWYGRAIRGEHPGPSRELLKALVRYRAAQGLGPSRKILEQSGYNATIRIVYIWRQTGTDIQGSCRFVLGCLRVCMKKLKVSATMLAFCIVNIHLCPEQNKKKMDDKTLKSSYLYTAYKPHVYPAWPTRFLYREFPLPSHLKHPAQNPAVSGNRMQF